MTPQTPTVPPADLSPEEEGRQFAQMMAKQVADALAAVVSVMGTDGRSDAFAPAVLVMSRFATEVHDAYFVPLLRELVEVYGTSFSLPAAIVTGMVEKTAYALDRSREEARAKAQAQAAKWNRRQFPNGRP